MALPLIPLAIAALLGGGAATKAAVDPNIDLVPGFDPFTDRSQGSALPTYQTDLGDTKPITSQTNPEMFRDTPETGGSGTGAVGGGAQTQYPALNQAAINAINSSMSQLPTLRDQQLATQRASRDAELARLADAERVNRNKYDTDMVTTNQNHARNLMQSLYAGTGGLQSLMSILRGQGAASGTARDLVYDTVAQQTARDIAGGDQTRQENASALDNFINTFLSKKENEERGINQTFENNQRAIQANELSERQKLLNSLAETYGAAGRTSEAQRYAADAIGLNPQITNLSNRGVAEYAPSSIEVAAPTLNSYAGPSTTGVTAGGGQGTLGSGVFTLGDFRKRLQAQGA